MTETNQTPLFEDPSTAHAHIEAGKRRIALEQAKKRSRFLKIGGGIAGLALAVGSFSFWGQKNNAITPSPSQTATPAEALNQLKDEINKASETLGVATATFFFNNYERDPEGSIEILIKATQLKEKNPIFYAAFEKEFARLVHAGIEINMPMESAKNDAAMMAISTSLQQSISSLAAPRANHHQRIYGGTRIVPGIDDAAAETIVPTPQKLNSAPIAENQLGSLALDNSTRSPINFTIGSYVVPPYAPIGTQGSGLALPSSSARQELSPLYQYNCETVPVLDEAERQRRMRLAAIIGAGQNKTAPPCNSPNNTGHIVIERGGR